MAISLTKIEQEAPELLSLAKTASSAVAKHRMAGQKSKVALILDYSGSMRNDYANGSMQRLAEKVLALGTQLDDDGAIDLFLFDTESAYMGEVTLSNFRDFIAQATRNRHMGLTYYAKAFRVLMEHYGLTPVPQKTSMFGKKKFVPLAQPVSEPILAIFLTDGAPSDRADAIETITQASYAPIFWQFLSIGKENIQFLQKLDDLDGRFVDNADYKPVGNVDKLGDEELYSMLLDEYPDWVADQRSRRQIL